ncbi:sporulation integral membrane protein YtvI [Paenibacillus sp. HJGM_3]|uniref:sporulation integral membrane protein YtvI n=1 Tax=Paenibacillus sp. HJGM_3 TaxID=3379816 RepID=UPI00385AD0D6
MDAILQKQLLRGLWVVLLIVAAAAFVYFVTPMVSPFLIGWLIAYILNPLVNMLQRRGRMPRWLAVTVSLLLFLGITATIVSLLVTNIVYEVADLSAYIQENIESWKNKFVDFVHSDYLQGVIDQLNRFYLENPKYQSTINDNLASTGVKLANAGSTMIGFVLNGIVGLLKSLPNVATVMLIALLAAFFISKDWYRIIARVSSWFPKRPLQTAGTIWSDLQKALFGYVRAQFILISITAMFVIVGLLILDVPYAITIGLLIGFVDLLPYLGTGAAMVPWIIFVFVQGNLYLGIGLSILYGVILVARSFLEPKVLASSIGLDPLATLIAMFIGLKLFGFVGVIIGPVTLVLLSAIQRANVFQDIWGYIKHGKNHGVA